jgi:hypothetical protein
MTPEQKQTLLRDIQILKNDLNADMEIGIKLYESSTITTLLTLTALCLPNTTNDIMTTLAKIGLYCVSICSKELWIKKEEQNESAKKD